MEYSIDDMCKLAKVSPRTLHYYDEIELLIPAIRMTSGKRYYSEEQIFKLMDIIFFKKMGFSLKKIKSILQLGNQDKRALMLAKKEFLQKEIKRIKKLIASIEDTLEFYLKGENKNYDQMIKQFELFQQETKEDKQKFLQEFGSLEDEETKKLKNLSVSEQIKYVENLYKGIDMQQYGDKLQSCFQKLTEAIDKNLKEDSQEVQNLMKEYFTILHRVCPMSKKKWLSQAVKISEDKEEYVLYAKMHTKLPAFLVKAIQIYGESLVE